MTGHSNMALAANPKIEYKCFFELIGGDKEVHYVVSIAPNASAVKGQMQGKSVFAKNGVTKKFIYKVLECVKSGEKFTLADAQAADAKTLS